jgi:amino acid adenylation domain-containing protein
MFINTLPMRMKLDRAGVGEAIRSAHSGLGELMEHEQASLVLAQNCSGIQLPMPLFTALIDYRHSRFDGGEISEVWDGVRLVSDAVRNNYPLTLLVDDLGDAFSLKIRTASGIDAARIMNYVETSIGEIVRGADPAQERMLLDLEILPSSERQLLLEGFNRTQADHAHDRTIHRLFEAQAARTPQATAVESGSRRLSYAELNRHADKVAGRLIALGVKPDDRVAVCIDRSPEMVIGILGALKAGGAYVPLDPLYPADRLAYMLEDCAPVAVLTRASLHAGLPMPQSPTVPVLDVEEIVRSSPDAAPDPGFSGSKAANLAYVIYTSGSTGRPKGVMVEHRSAVNFWEVMRRTTHRDCGEAARVGLNAAFSFDMSLKGLLQLLSGHCVVLIPQEVRASGAALLEFIERHRIDVFDITPSQMEPLLAAGLLDGAGHRPRDVLLGGEAIGTTMWDRLKSSPKVRFHNMYGPTECTVDATIQRMSEATDGPVIGSPVANTRIYLLDPVGRPVPIGAIGEIHIGGVQVARGYLNRPELTAERFLQDPFSQDPSSRMYRTGDLGRWRSDGTLEYAGRNDMQVKLRGFRIELGEIEAKLAACAGVREAVATVRKDAARDERLVAYVVAHPGATPSAMELRERLSQSLPDYMIPSAFVRLDRLPLTPNGKLDRRALPAPDMASVSSRGYEPPAGEAEQVLAEIWRTLLGLERVGRQDHFFELGGHSLLVMQLVNRIRKQFHVDVPLRTLFDRPVLSDLAESIVGIQGEVFLGDDLERMQSELGALSVEELQRILDRESIDQ